MPLAPPPKQSRSLGTISRAGAGGLTMQALQQVVDYLGGSAAVPLGLNFCRQRHRCAARALP